ncbi:MAG: ATP-binding protein [Microscillaceae bacterium]|nr:ATP-binding protein [Microscillaceae bacterium]
MQDLIQKLNSIPTLSDIPENQITWLAERGEICHYQVGDYIFKRGDAMLYMLILLEGMYEIKIEQNGQLRPLSEVEPGGITGALPYSRAKNVMAQGIALENSTIFRLDRKYFEEMIHTHYELTERLVHTLTNRVRDFTKQQQIGEKMLALGKIAAGLAHELNNPAAAVVRSASELRKHLGVMPEKFKSVIKIRMSDQQVDTVNDILFAKINQGPKANLSLMKKTELEDEIADWLEDHRIDDGYSLASDFMEFGLCVEDFEKINSQISEEKDLAPVIKWIDNVLVTEKLVQEIEEASKRISDLVNSVKIYTHMDKSPEKQMADIHEGILNTLTILKHKFKKNKVEFIPKFQPDLPQVKIQVGELNQVWTNLIDNALDAMEEQGGCLEIKTYQAGDFVKVEVIDTGKGIPENVQSQIFDPFFTTKEVGKGTGIGLDVVKRVVDQHRGDIKVESKPGQTRFVVCLPL